jgi:hypothetical protein
MVSDEFMAREILGHGAYLCLRASDPAAVRRAGAEVMATAERLGLAGEYEGRQPAPRDSIAFLRRIGATAADIADDGLLHAQWVIHVASPRGEAVAEFSEVIAKRLGSAATIRTVGGVVRPKNYTGAALNNWAYARQVVQQPGAVMPNAFLVPLSKTADWWRKDWMERHTYFLPRYDDQGRMVAEGHALATEPGIACLLRRTYKAPTERAAEGEYEFVSYFECRDEDVPVFHQVCAALRDVRRNPEWRFVREGPTWHGRRVPTWDALFPSS